MKIIQNFGEDLIILFLTLNDKKSAFLLRLIAILGIGYVILPFDFIPEWIPFTGIVDDLLIVPGVSWVLLSRMQSDQKEEIQGRAQKIMKKKNVIFFALIATVLVFVTILGVGLYSIFH